MASVAAPRSTPRISLGICQGYYLTLVASAATVLGVSCTLGGVILLCASDRKVPHFHRDSVSILLFAFPLKTLTKFYPGKNGTSEVLQSKEGRNPAPACIPVTKYTLGQLAAAHPFLPPIFRSESVSTFI